VGGDIRIGISGWRYAPWRGQFYPPGLAQRRELEFAAERFSSVEINGSFYSLQRPSSYLRWRDETPDDFVFAVKGGRYLTHMLRLRDTRAALANFFASGVLALGPKLGPILWQLPARQEFDAEQLAGFFASLPRSTTHAAELALDHDSKLKSHAWTTVDADRPLRHALEVRHDSFASEEAIDLLRAHDISLVVADTAGVFPDIRAVTSDFVYVRLHGEDELYVSGYTDESLERWASLVRGWSDGGRDVFVYFDNDAKVRAPFDAMTLASLISRGDA
jgi:uncharacterized protein YecE (DUF72 family)